MRTLTQQSQEDESHRVASVDIDRLGVVNLGEAAVPHGGKPAKDEQRERCEGQATREVFPLHPETEVADDDKHEAGHHDRGDHIPSGPVHVELHGDAGVVS